MSTSALVRSWASSAYFILFSTLLAAFALFRQRGLEIAADDVEALAVSTAFLVILGKLFQQRGLIRLGNTVELVPLFLMISLSFAVLGMGVAAGSAPLIDAGLASADRLFFPFLDWIDAIRWVERRAGTGLAILDFAYSSMGLQALSVVALTCLCGERTDCERFIATWVLALSATMIVSAIYPAAGALKYFAINHADVPAIQSRVGWSAIPIIEGLRNGTITRVDWGNLEGLVSFPSFHAAAALILGRFYWSYRVLRWPMASLNVLMAVAAVPCGGHYFVDVFGGIVTAAAALVITSSFAQRPMRSTPLVRDDRLGPIAARSPRYLSVALARFRLKRLFVNPVSMVDRGAG